MSARSETASATNLAAPSASPPNRPIQLLFIHHSCGGQLLATAGPPRGANCIYASHPNGGGLRARLEQSSYGVHEASYGSKIGQKTDLFDWLPKFGDEMEEIVTCDLQDASYHDGRRNQIVVFKPCFPNNAFRSEGKAPGNPDGPELTVWNATAAYTLLLDEFRKKPDVLFVCVTAPPMTPKSRPRPLWKRLARWMLRRGQASASQLDTATGGRLARLFNNWLSGRDGWLKDYSLPNVVVFDYFAILTDHGESGLAAYPTGGGYDSHPSREGNEKAAEAFVPFLNRAARRAGLSP